MKKLFTYLSLCLVLLIPFLAGCQSQSQSKTSGNSEESSSSSNSKYEKFITVDVFSNLANYQGIQSGWFAKIVKEKFNMELNIIAPNVAGGGDTLYQTRTAAGDLGDLIIAGSENGRLQDLVEGGLLLDMSKYMDKADSLNQYTDAIKNINSLVEEDGIYGIPGEVSLQPATNPSEGLEPTFGPYLRWDLYAELGYPEIKSLDDLLDVLEDMQKLYPKTENGEKVYALSLFPDWDGNMLNNAKQPTTYYGYDELGFVLAKADGSDFQSILDKDSQYVQVLKFFNEAYQRGLVDPESSTQTYDTLFAKYQNGQVLFSFWPWLGQAAYNTTEHLKEGKGFMLAPIDGMQIFSYGANPLGSKTFIGVGSKAEDPGRMVDFINWLYSPEGIAANGSDTNGASGPEGLTWEMKDGKPVLTDFGIKALVDGGAEVPKEWGGGTYKDGVSALNFPTVFMTDTNPETGQPYAYTLWESYQEKYLSTPLHKDWQEKMGATTTMEYLKKNNKLLVAPGSGYIAPAESAEITTLRGQIKEVIVPYSWQMVYAKNKSEFSKLLKEMQTKATGLGYKDVLKLDMKNAKEQDVARKKAASK